MPSAKRAPSTGLHRSVAPLARLAMLVELAACTSHDSQTSGTRGELGRVEFAYQRSCFFGCPLDQPLLEGTREDIGMSAAGDVEGARVESSDPNVATFALERACHCERSDSSDQLDIREDAACPSVWHKVCDNDVLVAAGSAGEAKLELRDANDTPIDRVNVIVHEAHDASFAGTLPDQLGADISTQFELQVGKSIDLALTLYDEAGLKLLAPEGVDWRVDDATIATLSAFLIGSGADVQDGLAVSVQALAPGDTQVHVTVPGLDPKLDLHITQ